MWHINRAGTKERQESCQGTKCKQALICRVMQVQGEPWKGVPPYTVCPGCLSCLLLPRESVHLDATRLEKPCGENTQGQRHMMVLVNLSPGNSAIPRPAPDEWWRKSSKWPQPPTECNLLRLKSHATPTKPSTPPLDPQKLWKITNDYCYLKSPSFVMIL